MNLEKVEKKNKVKLIVGLLIFFGGTITLKLIGLEDLIGLVSGFGGALFGVSAIALFKIKNNPEDYKDEVISQSDERGTAIRGYASYATMIAMLGAIFILSVVGILWANDFLLFLGAGSMVFVLISFYLFAKYYEKKL